MIGQATTYTTEVSREAAMQASAAAAAISKCSFGPAWLGMILNGALTWLTVIGAVLVAIGIVLSVLGRAQIKLLILGVVALIAAVFLWTFC